MKQWKYLVVAFIAIFALLGLPAMGDSTNAPVSPYAKGQVTALTFATYQTSADSLDNGAFGVGVGVQASVCKYFAVQASTSKAEGSFNSGGVIQNLSLTPVLRYPIGNTGFAPYLLGGVTFQFDDGRDTAYSAGGGVEYRFGKHLGSFADYQRVFLASNDGPDNNLFRAGLNWTF